MQIQRAVADKSDESKRRNLDAQELVCAVAAREFDGPASGDLVVEVHPEATDVHIDGIESELTVAFENVILNAKQATENRGRLEILVRNISRGGNRWISIRFRDSGPGFERPEKATQLGWTTKSASGGTGTGLSIVERVVLQHDGDLSIRNALVEGWGAEVEIALPVVSRSWVAKLSTKPEDGN
jgi:signal transduction histidine kinase